MADRDYRSIGEVLVALKPEFPDITISKIRFLESEGLIDPERTASGYRKFYDTDVTRLRRILRLQRDEYLPLRVIRQRLQEDGDAPPVPEQVESETEAEDEIGRPQQGLQMTADEMSQATGVDAERIDQLVSFGLLHPRKVGEERFFDGEDLAVLHIVADFLKYGVEARHLTMFRHFAEREAAFLQAIIMPLMRQRNPDARRAANSSLTELAGVSRRLKQALLRANLRRALGP
ncbi:MAG TPA: MerR family transcriptional regulator [Actinomycetota bacterium]|nr:MerR family transcriptional regulator [Actinomycetota bacterium]